MRRAAAGAGVIAIAIVIAAAAMVAVAVAVAMAIAVDGVSALAGARSVRGASGAAALPAPGLLV